MLSVLLGLVGIAVCVIASYEAVLYWHSVNYVSVKRYAMIFYYGLIDVVGTLCILC